jgi:hypothetical protein
MPTKTSWAPLSDARIEQARQDTRERDKHRPRAKSASYDAKTRRLHLEFVIGSALEIPIASLRGFDGATPAQIAAVEIVENGNGLHWEELDVQASVVALIQLAFNVKVASEFARQGGQARTEAKQASSRENGKLGGRPRKVRFAA